jgi:glycerol-3-phosphate O-acyltransferase
MPKHCRSRATDIEDNLLKNMPIQDHKKEDALASDSTSNKKIATRVSSGPAVSRGHWKKGAPNFYVRLINFFFGRFFRKMGFDSTYENKIRELSEKGTVVYIMRYRSPFDFMIFNYLYYIKGLPLAYFGNDITSLHYLPLFGWLYQFTVRLGAKLKLTTYKPLPGDAEVLGRVTEQGDSSIIFLKKPLMRLRPTPIEKKGLLEALFKANVRTGRPVFLLPQVILWTKKPRTPSKSVLDIVLGESDKPSRLRKTIMFWLNFRSAFIKYGDPIEVSDFSSQTPHFSDRQLARKLRHKLLAELYREERTILGPPVRNRQVAINSVLLSRDLRDDLIIAARNADKPLHWAYGEARNNLEEIVSNYRTTVIEVLDHVLTPIWNRIFEGFALDQQGLEKVKLAAKKAPIILIPAHRSHADYLILSYIFWHNNLTPPHIAAGVNLSFWPLGVAFRNAGAFFIRRSFKDNEIYSAAFEHYMRYLMREGFPLEFFIEGTRSRSGKSLQPKLGMLQTLMNSVARQAVKDAYFIPVGITYEKIIEGGEYIGELKGGDKKKERLGGLIKTPTVLRSRYGQVYINFDDPISYCDFEKHYGRQWTDLEPHDQRLMAAELANKICYGFNKVITVTPTALIAIVMLSHHKRGITYNNLLNRCELLIKFLQYRKAPMSASLANPGESLDKALKILVDSKIIQQIEIEQERIFSIEEDKRMALDYYKNTIIHFFITTSFLANIIVSLDSDSFSLQEANDKFNFLMNLLKREFIYRTKISTDQYFNEVIDYFISEGVIESSADRATFTLLDNRNLLSQFKVLALNFIESYYIVLETAQILEQGPMEEKEFLKQILVRGQRHYAIGDILRYEALAKINLQSATAYFVKEELFEKEKRKRRADLISLVDDDRRKTLIKEIRNFLG